MFLGSMPIHRVLCLASILLSQLCVIWDICKKSNQGGLFFQLRGSNSQFEDPSYLFDTITVFLKVVFRNSNSSWRFSVSQRALTLCTNFENQLVCWKDGDVILSSGRG
jgi:hypothetical protein